MKPLDQSVVAEALVGVEPLVKVLGRREHLGKEEVEKGPQLVEVVLERSSGQQQAVGRLQLSHHKRQLGLFVLDPVIRTVIVFCCVPPFCTFARAYHLCHFLGFSIHFNYYKLKSSEGFSISHMCVP